MHLSTKRKSIYIYVFQDGDVNCGNIKKGWVTVLVLLKNSYSRLLEVK